MKKIGLLIVIVMMGLATIAQKSKMREATTALASGKLDKAKEYIDIALQDASLKNDPKAYLVKGKIYQKIAEDPTGLYRKLSDNAAIDAYSAYMEAVKKDTKGKIKKKIKPLLGNLINPMAREGEALYGQKKYKTAADVFEKVLEIENSEILALNKVDTAMMFNVALSAEKGGDYERALKYYKKTKEMGYQEAKTFARLSAVLKGLKREDEATKMLEEGSKKFPNDLNIIFELINVNLLGGTPEKASEYVDKAIELEPKNASLYRAKATIYEKTGDLEGATKCYEKALALNPKDFTSQYNIAVMQLKDVEKRREEVNNIMDVKEYNAALEGLLNRYEKTIPYFEKALELKEGDQSTIQILKEIYYKLRDRSPEMKEKYQKYEAMFNK